MANINSKIIPEIFTIIMSFLPIRNIYNNRNVCKKWCDILVSKLAKKIIGFEVPKYFKLLEEKKVDFNIINILYINNQIFISGVKEGRYVLYDHIKIKFYYDFKFVSFNSKYICAVDIHSYVRIFTLEFKEIDYWKCDNIDYLTIDENSIYIIKLNSCYIYDFKGKLIKIWKKFCDDLNPRIKMLVDKQKIYVTINDCKCGRLQIFSQNERLIKNVEINKNNYYYYITFSVSSNIIYIFDFIDNAIKYYTCNGDLIAKFSIDIFDRYYKGLTNILVIDDYLYVSFWGSYFLLFKIFFS
jgi:hypothetical protein